MTIRDVVIENSTNTNFIIVGVDRAIVENIWLQDSSYYDTNIQYHALFLQDINEVIIKNVTAINHRGPILRFSNVFNAQINDSRFIGTTTSQELSIDTQNLLHITPAELSF